MKNLILLLTSFLLAGTANAGFAEFTTDTPQVEEWQDFQVAHDCGAHLIHIPKKRGRGSAHTSFGLLGNGGKDGRGHVEFGKCEHRWKIVKCQIENRVINLWADSNDKSQSVDAVCGPKCPFGYKPGDNDKSIRCVPDECPEGTVWQPQHHAWGETGRCAPVSELVAHCKSSNQIYNRDTRQCEKCPQASIAQESGCKTITELNTYCASVNPNFVYGLAQDACVSIFDLRKYCKDNFNQGYVEVFADCFPCPADTPFPQASGCKSLAELNTYCASTNPAFIYGVAQDACVSLFDMRKYCKDEFGKDYNAGTAECEACPAGSFPQKSGCRTLAELNAHCEGVKSGDVYGVAQDACVSVIDLRRHCRNTSNSTYNKDNAQCESCPANHFPQDSGCVSLANLVKYCKDNGNQAFDSVNNTCISCSDSEVLRIHEDGSSSCGDNSIERCDEMNLAFSSRTEECVTCRDIMVPYEGLCQASKQACNYRDRFFFAETGCVDRCPANTIERDGECVCRLKSGGSCASVDYLRKRCTNSGKVFNTTTGECSNS